MMKFISADNWGFSRAEVEGSGMRGPVSVVVGMCAGVHRDADEWPLWQIHNLGLGAAAEETNS